MPPALRLCPSASGNVKRGKWIAQFGICEMQLVNEITIYGISSHLIGRLFVLLFAGVIQSKMSIQDSLFGLCYVLIYLFFLFI